jgi:hypothetical protein
MWVGDKLARTIPYLEAFKKVLPLGKQHELLQRPLHQRLRLIPPQPRHVRHA